MAARLGLSAEMVEELREAVLNERARINAEPPLGTRKSAKTHPMVGVLMPDAAKEAWQALADRVHMDPRALLRGAIHEYLLDRVEPERLDDRWVVGGYVYHKPKTSGSRGRNKHLRNGNFWTAVSRGARDALNARAEGKGITRHTLLIGLMNDVLSGRRVVRRPITRWAMYADSRRYLS